MVVLGDVNRLTWRALVQQQLSMLWVTPMCCYLEVLVMGLAGDQAQWMIGYILPGIVLIFGMLFPYLIVRLSIIYGLTVSSRDSQAEVLSRLLRVPRLIEVGLEFNYTVATTLFMAVAVVKYDLSWVTVPWGTTLTMLLATLVMVWTRLRIARMLSPIVLQEFVKDPNVQVRHGGFLWPRQSWYLPYLFAIFIICSILMTITVIVGVSREVFGALIVELQQGTQADVSAVVYGTVSEMIRQSTIPIVSVLLFLLISASFIAWTVARYESEGARAVQQSIESLLSDKPLMPQWVTTDEIGDLSFATARAFDQLQRFSLSLLDSAKQLGRCAEQLNSSNSTQNESLTRQAAALQETQVTAQEIKQTSELTSQKAEGILRRIDEVDEVSRSGELALERSMESIKGIRQHVSLMVEQIRALEERTQQIGKITQTVKDLADQSNMLALNAAIEAVRSGEAGKGFGVVAREIRSLADQSIRATNNVRQILQDVTSAIRVAVDSSVQGVKKVEASLIEINSSGDSIRSLASIVRDNASSVRQISAAVSQQNMGISQIFQAVSDLSRMMDDTMGRLKMTTNAMEVVQEVARKVFAAVGSRDWQQTSGGAMPPPGQSGSVATDSAHKVQAIQ